jgi:hypothetical protein
MSNMKIKFHFNIIDLKDEHFCVDSSRFYKFTSICKKYLILQMGYE